MEEVWLQIVSESVEDLAPISARFKKKTKRERAKAGARSDDVGRQRARRKKKLPSRASRPCRCSKANSKRRERTRPRCTN